MRGMTETRSAHAISMQTYGPPEVLQFHRVPLPSLEPGEVRMRTLFAAVNHTDLQIRRGAWPLRSPDPFPYVPGVEVVGIVEACGSAVSEDLSGQTVITMMQGLGGVRAERQGGYAEFVTVDADAVATVPTGVDPGAMAALGLAGVTAFEGMRRLGPLGGRRLLVTGAAGGVGSAACSLGVSQGAYVLGLVSHAEQKDYVRSLGAQEVLVAPRDEAPQILPASVDAVLDTVAGRVFPIAVAAIRDGGILSLVGAVDGGDVSFDAWNLIRPVTLTGYSSENLTGDDLRVAIAGLATSLSSGAIRCPEYEIIPLHLAAEAHRRLEVGGVTGRVLLRPS